MSGCAVEPQNRHSLAQGPKKSLKQRGPRVGVRWKGRRKQHPVSPFSATKLQAVKSKFRPQDASPIAT
jgi:hypothetical protein